MVSTTQITINTSGSINSGHVVQIINGLAAAASSSNNLSFGGIAIQTTTTGQSNIIQIGGQISTSIINLGDGYACAIGINSSGLPVRVTDPTCASGLNYIGYCDIHGKITIAPKQTDVLVATDFGLIGDGVTPNDDVNTLMINSIACQLGKSIFYPGGNYVFAKTIGPYPLGCTVAGAGISGRATGLSSSIGTTFLFSGYGVGLQAGGHAPQANVSNGATFQDLEILGINPNGNASYPNINEIGIEVQTDTEVKLKNIRLGGFKYQLSFDGCETCVADGIYFEGIPPSNLGYPAATMITDSGVNSAFAARFGAFNSQVGASACNGNILTNVQLNNTYWGFFHQGGIGNVVSNVNSEIKGVSIFGGDGYSAATIQTLYQNIIGEGTLTGFRFLTSAYTPTFTNIRLGQDGYFLDIRAPIVNLNMIDVYLINTSVIYPVIGAVHINGGACIGCPPPDGDGYSTAGVIFDVDPGMLVDSGVGTLGIYCQPLSPLDINGNRLRIRTSHAPSSTSDSFGNIGDISWDSNYLYAKTGVGNWKRSPLSVIAPIQDGYVLTWDDINGDWIAKPLPVPIITNSFQTVWHINFASGNDSHDGLTSGTAIKTWAEYTRRTGIRPYINFTIDMYIHGDLGPDDVALISGDFGPLGFFNIHGVPTVIHSGTLSAVTAYDQASGQGDEIADGSFDWTSYCGADGSGHGQLVVITTGSPNGPSYCWPAAPLTSPTRARVSFLGLRDISEGYPYFESIGPASPGNTYEIWQLPILTNVIFDYQVYTKVFEPQIYAEFISFPDFSTPIYPFLASECYFPNYTGYGTLPPQIVNCLYTGLVSGGLILSCLGLAFNASILTTGWNASGLIMQTSQVLFDVLDITGNPWIESHHAAYGFGVFDSDTPFVLGYGGSLIVEAAIWGKNNTGVSFKLYNGGNILVDGYGKLLIQNNVADISIDGFTSLPAVNPTTFAYSSAIPLTIANLNTSFGSGGFGGYVFNPLFPASGIATTSS